MTQPTLAQRIQRYANYDTTMPAGSWVYEGREIIADLTNLLTQAHGALKAGEQFIKNGVEMKYVFLPTIEIDPATKTLPYIEEILFQIESAGIGASDDK